jgi:exosortase J
MAASAAARSLPTNIATKPQTTEWRSACAIFSLTILGLWWMLGTSFYGLWKLWTTNGLASIGILIPPAVLFLTWRAWRGKVWNGSGTWWGLALCVLAFVMQWIAKGVGIPVLLLHGPWLILMPSVLVLFLYCSGVVLLFAGYEAYRAAFFPVSLLLFLNPAPSFITSYVDLPLQYVGAHTARAFAQWIGVPLAVDDLRLMFSPALGMFVAPGCNGLRSALAMGLLTLIIGHLYRLPIWLRVGYVASSVVLAYLLNLVRLCGLVLCYRVALNFNLLGRHMEAVDYVLGSLIFFTAATFVIAMPRKWTRIREQRVKS